MCGRFTLRTSAKAIAEQFELGAAPDLTPRFNIAPTQSAAAVRLSASQNQRELVMLHWGLIPFWAKERKIGYSMINARAETVDSKPAFRQAFKKRRCLVLSDGFYEWKKIEDKKQPFYIHMRDDRPFAFAGLWERWQTNGDEIESCTIIVTEASELMRLIHERMPVILDPADYDLWLDLASGGGPELRELMRPYSGQDLQAHRVSTVVNSPKNDVEECVRRID